MKNVTKAAFIYCIGLLIIGILLIITTILRKEHILFMILGILFFIAGAILLKVEYPLFLTENRKSNYLFEKLTDEEREIIEDAKNLIRKVDENIIISEFNVYKVKFLMHGWFNYDKNSQELNIFIPFKLFLRFGKDLCFLAVLHEVLHSQNSKNNLKIFDLKFLEGLNQLLTIWLIESYSEKYKIPQKLTIFSIRIAKDLWLNIDSKYDIYINEVKLVEDILQNAQIDYKELFLKYIDIQPEFFKAFVPSKYFVK